MVVQINDLFLLEKHFRFLSRKQNITPPSPMYRYHLYMHATQASSHPWSFHHTSLLDHPTIMKPHCVNHSKSTTISTKGIPHLTTQICYEFWFIYLNGAGMYTSIFVVEHLLFQVFMAITFM